MKKFRIVFAGLLMLAAFAGFLKLGFWQLERLEWKENLMARIEAQKTVDPAGVNLEAFIDDPDAEFRRGYVTGRWLRDRTGTVGPRLKGDAWGYWLVTPLELAGGRTLIVNRGWAATPGLSDILNAQPADAGYTVTVTGALRRPGALADEMPESALVLFMESSTPADDPRIAPAPLSAELRNDHRQYAVFWFTMAGLVLVLAGYAGFTFSLPKGR